MHKTVQPGAKLQQARLIGARVIAVTGAGGFVGTELLARLNTIDNVSVVALTRDASGRVDTDHCRWRSTDYSYKSLKDIFSGTDADGQAYEPVDAVIHLAGVRGTEDDPAKFAVNLRMTNDLVRAMAVSGVRRIVFASSMSVYNADDFIPWKEDEAPLRGRSRYGDSKADCEDIIRGYEKIFRNTGMPITYGIVRIAQVMGEGEKRRGVMNVFIDTARGHGTLKVMGRSANKKQYIYVKDLAEILTALALGNERFDPEENIIVNAGMEIAYTNLELAHIINEVFENDTPVEYEDSYPEKNRPFLMDTSRLREKLGIVPLDIREALENMKVSSKQTDTSKTEI